METTNQSSQKAVDVGKLEKELLAMWEANSGGEGTEGGVTRSCVLNLVICAPKDTPMQRVDQILTEVVEIHPCRAQLLLVDRAAAEPQLSAFVSTRCQMSKKGKKQICGEQVTIEAGGPGLGRVSTVVGPLLVPDIPVFLWWDGKIESKDELFQRLGKLCERVIVDSANFHKPVEDFAGLARVITERRKDLRIKDLAWGRLTSWRTVVAGFWDVPDHRASLSRVSKVVIEAPPPAAPVEGFSSSALLALGWLASALDWNLSGVRTKAMGAEALRVEIPGQAPTITVTLRSAGSAQVRGDQLPSLSITTEDGHIYEVKVRCCGTKLETRVTTPAASGNPHVLEQVLPIPEEKAGHLLARELEILGRDQVYEKCVLAVARLLDAREGATSVY